MSETTSDHRATWAAQLAARDHAALAVRTAERDWSTTHLLEMAGRAAAWLDELGVPAGTPVPALLHATPEAIALIVAGALTARPIAPIGALLTASEVAAVLAGFDTAPERSTLVADPGAMDLAAAVAERTASLPDLAERPPAPPLEPARSGVQADDVAVVLHTSGTSGVPKRVELRHGVLAARTVVNGGLLDLGPGDVYVTAKGIHHVGGLGLTLVALGVGAGVIPLRRFDTAAWGALAALGPTHASFVPTMIEMLLGADGMTLPSLRIVQYGGAPIRPATLERLVREHPELGVVALYGQTEGSPIASLSPSDHRAAVADRPDLLETAGRAAPGVGLRIVDPDTGVEPSEPDGVGEIVARADHFALPGDDGWLRTGDLGRIDAEGYLRIVGRLGDVITRGGENVHPGEVEQVLAGHPGVADVAVAAVPDDRLGQTVGAWIVPRQPDAPPDPEALRAFARARLAGFKVPTVWTFRAALPRNPNGKVVRGRLTL